MRKLLVSLIVVSFTQLAAQAQAQTPEMQFDVPRDTPAPGGPLDFRAMMLMVGPGDYERVRDELKARLEALGDENGRPIGTIAHRPEELYPERKGIPPDLLVYFGDLYWRSIGQVGTDAVHVFENDTGPDDANHAFEGLYVVAAAGATPGRGDERDLRDVAPTILTLLGEPVPDEMEGTPLV